MRGKAYYRHQTQRVITNRIRLYIRIGIYSWYISPEFHQLRIWNSVHRFNKSRPFSISKKHKDIRRCYDRRRRRYGGNLSYDDIVLDGYLDDVNNLDKVCG